MSQKLQAEFIVRQYYTVLVNEDRIDEGKAHWQADSPHIEPYFTRMHRMFNAIVADKKALHAVVEYQVLREHEYVCDDGVGGYLETHYGAEPSLPEILASLTCFSEDDTAWVHDLAEKHKHPLDDSEGEYDKLEELAEAFKAEPSGWNIGPHVHPNG